jgi:3-oxoacyl-[acyl-carrier-protein] synthase III
VTGLTSVIPKTGIERVDLEDLFQSHGLSTTSVRMYRRFFELRSVLRHSGDLRSMLRETLIAVAERLLSTSGHFEPGYIVFCKTQTHNTYAGIDWLAETASKVGFEGWECFTLSMTNCASTLAAIHWATRIQFGLASTRRPVVLIAGEKAFHPAVSRLSVGLLGELPVALVLSDQFGDWHIRASFLRHMPRFYANPDDMCAEDKRLLNDHFLEQFCSFLNDALTSDQDFSGSPYTVVPYNLNLPVLTRISQHFGWQESIWLGDISEDGHTYCSDIPANLQKLLEEDGPPPERVFAFAAGMGVTFACILLERNHPTKTH